MSVQWMSWAWKFGPADPTLRYILVRMADFANQEGYCFPSIESISSSTCLSESTVRRAISDLEKGGWMTVIRGVGRGCFSQYNLIEKVSEKNLSHKKVSEKKVSLERKKGVTVTEKGVTDAKPPTPPIVEEPSLTVIEPKTKYISAKRVRSDDGMKHSSDPRHVACKEAVFAYYRSKNDGEDPSWNGREGRSLGMLLGANPKLTANGIARLLEHRARSEVNHGDRPGMWIENLPSYRSGPIDRFGKPLNGGGNGYYEKLRKELEADED